LSSGDTRWIPLLVTVALAFLLWFVTFYLTWSTFWLKISLSAAALAGISLWIEPNRKQQFRFTLPSIVIGLLSAGMLYGIFWMGRAVSTAIFPFADHQIGGIYGIGEGTSMWVIALLLFLVTGPCEEIYWRGYLQENLMRRFGRRQGWLLATGVYAVVHIWSLNFMLIGAAAVAGLFWGAMYRYLGNLAPVIISHSIWSGVIFAVFPMH
jgi:membrane protease YdiL (CAAX protease family)